MAPCPDIPDYPIELSLDDLMGDEQPDAVEEPKLVTYEDIKSHLNTLYETSEACRLLATEVTDEDSRHLYETKMAELGKQTKTINDLSARFKTQTGESALPTLREEDVCHPEITSLLLNIGGPVSMSEIHTRLLKSVDMAPTMRTKAFNSQGELELTEKQAKEGMDTATEHARLLLFGVHTAHERAQDKTSSPKARKEADNMIATYGDALSVFDSIRVLCAGAVEAERGE
jgi:hypothetical protein